MGHQSHTCLQHQSAFWTDSHSDVIHKLYYFHLTDQISNNLQLVYILCLFCDIRSATQVFRYSFQKLMLHTEIPIRKGQKEHIVCNVGGNAFSLLLLQLGITAYWDFGSWFRHYHLVPLVQLTPGLVCFQIPVYMTEHFSQGKQMCRQNRCCKRKFIFSLAKIATSPFLLL